LQWLAKHGDHDGRYRRTAEYLHIVRHLLTSADALDFEGEFYRLEGAHLPVRPATPVGVPLYFGGASAAALDVGARFADVYMLWGEPLALARARIDAARAAAARFGRTLRFSVSVRPILAATEAAAWARAEDIAARAVAQRERFVGYRGGRDSTSEGSARLLAAAAEAEVLEERLWPRIAAITGAPGNSTALVGTPDQVAESLLRYVDLGCDALLIRGFLPYQDAVDYGRELIPIIRKEVAKRRHASGTIANAPTAPHAEQSVCSASAAGDAGHHDPLTDRQATAETSHPAEGAPSETHDNRT